MKKIFFLTFVVTVIFITQTVTAQTTALWLFNEQVGIYPSGVLSDAGPNDYPMVLGPGGQIVSGKFGNALEPLEQPLAKFPEGSVQFGLTQIPTPAGRTVQPMSWMNANFAALMTSGENHLRKEVRFARATATKLNLGDFDWTVEFWYMPTRSSQEDGVVFEIGQGPRGENDHITRLLVTGNGQGFRLVNQPSATDLFIPSDENAFNPDARAWHHFAFVYSARDKQLRHYCDGKRQKLPRACSLKALKIGDEDYFTVGRDGLWQHPLPGRIDELRFSERLVYSHNFKPPASLSPDQWQQPQLKAGPLLLFAEETPAKEPIQLGTRRHLFIDDALIDKMEHVEFNLNPPRLAECVIDSIEGPFRKHLSVIEDENGVIRMYYGGADDYLAVRTSRDGVHWQAPDVGHGEVDGQRNYVTHEPSAMGNVFIDPNAPPEARWKYVSGFQDRGIFVFYSADGWFFNRVKTAAIPLRSGSQSNMFYDDQRQAYIGYHRSDFGKTVGGKTQRSFGMAEMKNIMKPWPFDPVTAEETYQAAKSMRLRDPQPWYLDNGPLTPGGVGIEFPIVFGPDDDLDPVGTDMYVPKAIKYPWAPDTYLAFPLMYFHYTGDGPLTRQILAHPNRRKGSGPVETQLAVSRDAVHWQRYPQPAYVGIGRFGEHDIHQSYLAHGLVRRGEEIWQYCFSETRYHSSWQKDDEAVRAVYRFVQRLDGFVSADTPYDKEGVIITKPFQFKGNRLLLNIDTNASGYAQVGFLDEKGQAIADFSVDDCVYINGDFVDIEVEWIKNKDAVTIPYGNDIEDVLPETEQLKFTKDVSSLAGRTVSLMFRMRNAKLYALQFLERSSTIE